MSSHITNYKNMILVAKDGTGEYDASLFFLDKEITDGYSAPLSEILNNITSKYDIKF